jgi:N-terminal domain of anti-restriction factor ArdC
MKSEQIKEITDRAAEQLVAALQAGRSEALTMYLKAIGRFHRYSLHNVLLIASQKPNATHVAGFRTWNELGRFVKKGEKGIMILAPIIRRKVLNDDEEREEISRPIAGFRAAFVFDISQTDGKELPQIGVVQGNPRQYRDQLRQFASSQNILVEFSADIAPARGISFGGRITLESTADVKAVVGQGLEGDRYFNGTGHWSKHPGVSREVTLIEIEAIEALSLLTDNSSAQSTSARTASLRKRRPRSSRSSGACAPTPCGG